MDRADLDFKRLHHRHLHGAFFVLSAKKNTYLCRLNSRPVDRHAGIIYDRHDKDRGQTFVFLTTNFILPPLTLAELYRARRQVESFLQWIKQHR